MRLTVNGRELVESEIEGEIEGGTESGDGLSVAALVERLAEAGRGVAVAVNGTVVPRSTWATSRVVDGDAVEVLTAAQGG